MIKSISADSSWNSLLLISLIFLFFIHINCFSIRIPLTGRSNTHLKALSFIYTNTSTLNSKPYERVGREYTKTPSFKLGATKNDIHCGEIIPGTPLKRNEDGSILVDIGESKVLIASKSSLYFMNEDEHYRLNTLLNKQNEEDDSNSLRSIIHDTIHAAKKIPERKRRTNMIPRFRYPFEYEMHKKKERETIPYDIGVGSEIRPQDYSKPWNIKPPEFMKLEDKMDFLVTDISPYTDKIYGEFFSVNMVESKRRAYSVMFLESLNKAAQFIPYDAVVTDIMGEVIKVQIINGKFSEVFGMNAFTMSTGNDKVGDKIKVYLAGSDLGLEHVYLFRTQIAHPMLRKENLKQLFDSIVKYYAKSGKWFKASVDKIGDDVLEMRIFGQNDQKFKGYVSKDELPYNYPEELLNEVFMRKLKPHEYFKQKDLEINIGKMSYIYHYDNSLYVRINNLLISGGKRRIDSIMDVNNTSVVPFLTTKQYYKPSPTMEKYFLKMLKQTPDIGLRTDCTYPCLIIGNDGGMLYFAVNEKRKTNFTDDDEYYIGVMEAGQYSTNIPIGIMVQARFVKVIKYLLHDGYAVDVSDGDAVFKKLPLIDWLNHLNDRDLLKYNLRGIKEINVMMMSNFILPSAKSPALSEFFYMQPIMVDSRLVDHIHTESFTENLLSTDPRATTYLPNTEDQKQKRAVTLKNEKHEQGTWMLGKDDDVIAPPIYYTNNEELRDIYMKENLDPRTYRAILRIIDSARGIPNIVIREFFINKSGEPFWEFLERMKNPFERRKVTLAEAHEIERSVMLLLSAIQSFYLEEIYNMFPREEVMFMSIVPNSFEDTYFTTGQLREYYDIIKGDFVMDRRVSRSLLKVLRILTNPNYSFVGQMRNRHRRMLNDVFFYSTKQLNYASYKAINRPHVTRSNVNHDLSLPPSDDNLGRSSMMPYTEIMKNPRTFVRELDVYGFRQIRKLYDKLLELNAPFKYKYIQPPDADGVLEDLVLDPDDPEIDNPILDKFFVDVDINEYALNTLDGSKASLKELSKAWKRLNKYPTNISRTDLREYLEDIRKINTVHGIKLPII